MTLYEINGKNLTAIEQTKFGTVGIKERDDLQRLLRDQVDVLLPDAMVLCEEFGQWEESLRRIDLLLLDKNANLVVVELKRTESGGHMELQAIRYAAMVSTIDFEQAVEAHRQYLERREIDADPHERILEFLEWDVPDEDQFGQDVRILLASAEFSKELTSAVLWLNDRGIDIRCVRLRPHTYHNKVIINVEQLIPIKEAEEYQIKVREKAQKERRQKGFAWDEKSLLNRMTEKHGEAVKSFCKELIDWSRPMMDEINWGRGRSNGTFTAIVRQGSSKYHIFRLNTDGALVFMLDHLARKPEFEQPEHRLEIIHRLNQIEGLDLPTDKVAGRVRPRLQLLTDSGKIQQVKDTIEWIAQRVRAQESC